VVIENPEECPLNFSGIDPVPAKTYLLDSTFASQRGMKVFNICLSYRYQSIGYYVSLLAEARQQKPVPSITTIQDMKSIGMIRLISEEMQEHLQRPFTGIRGQKMSLNIYFGKTVDQAFGAIGSLLFKYFPGPFLKSDFTYANQWQLSNVSPLNVKEIPEGERHFAESVASEFFAGKRIFLPKRAVSRFDVAILHAPGEKRPPSNPRALKRFIQAAENLNINTELITREDSNRLSEFDALFIRETTNVMHHTYRIARKAVAEGLVVIDDPKSILRCSNKVYLAELLARYRIPIPKTRILYGRNLKESAAEMKFPCILKQPDSSFSQGVIMVPDMVQFVTEARKLLKKSDLLIAQEFVPTEFDWRIGILDRRPLFACRYYMAEKHWQIVGKDKRGNDTYGDSETLPVSKVPKRVIRVALRAANLIGDGLYGVDLKQIGQEILIMEVNDNPNIDAGIEDEVLQEELYFRIMEVFSKRVENLKAEGRAS